MQSPNVPVPPPRLWVIVARSAPIAVVFRRGPSKSWRIYKWDLATPDLELGGFFRGSMYPERSDLSPNGLLLGYFAAKDGSDSWNSFIAVSILPWLTALAAWETVGRWTSGCRFADNHHLLMHENPVPFHGKWFGKVSPPGARAPYRNMAFALIRYLRSRGVELPEDSPLRQPQLTWADLISPDRICAAHADGTLGIWDVSSGSPSRIWTADLNPLPPEQRSPDWAKSW